MLAYHNKPAIKSKYLARVIDHRVADEIIQGVYWQNGKGCAVGCTIHSGDHLKFETELGIPVGLALLEDRIFEGLPNSEAKEFPIQFLSAIRPGANLNGIIDKFMYWLIGGGQDGEFVFKNEGVRAAFVAAQKLMERKLSGETVPFAEWRKVGDDAYAIARKVSVATTEDVDAASVIGYISADHAADAASAATYATEVVYYAATKDSNNSHRKAFSTMKTKLLQLLADA